jgi:hypothetical protein
LTSSAALKDSALKDRALKDRALKDRALKDRALKDRALKDRDSSRDLRSRCRFAVHRPGIPEASPGSHGIPCRGSVPADAGARLVLADSLKVSLRTDIPGEVKRRFLPSLKTGVSTPQSR